MKTFIFLFGLSFFLECKENSQEFLVERTQMKNSFSKEDNPDTIICYFPLEPLVDTKKWQKFLQDNLVLNSSSIDTIPAGKYTVVAGFSIDADGEIDDVSILKDPGYGFGKRVANVIVYYRNQQKISKKYMESFKSYRRQLITFIIEEENRKDCKEDTSSELIL
jgi:adenine specific DNA methylase Mod